jgi:hypothetical protein
MKPSKGIHHQFLKWSCGVALAWGASGALVQSAWASALLQFVWEAGDGQVPGSAVEDGSVPLDRLDATGPDDADRYLRGNGTWSVPEAGGAPTCPDGSVAVNDQLCIETVSRAAPTELAVAAETCSNLDGHVCKSSEWMAACEDRVALGVTMFTEGEFVGDISSERGGGGLSFELMGQAGFTDCSRKDFTWAMSRFRCCYSLPPQAE